MTKRALETRTLKLEGMTCSACVNSIERALNNLEGVSATVNFASETAHILAPADILAPRGRRQIHGVVLLRFGAKGCRPRLDLCGTR